MFRWLRTLAKRFAAFLSGNTAQRHCVRSQRQWPKKVRRARPTTRPHLERVEDRVMLSGSPAEPMAALQPVVVQASPPPMPPAIDASGVAGQVIHLVSTLENDLSSLRAMVSQEVAQVVSYDLWRLESLLGVEPNAPSPPPAASATPSGNGLPAPRTSGVITPLVLSSSTANPPKVADSSSLKPMVANGPNSTTEQLSSSSNPSHPSQSVTFTAVVTGSASGGGTPTGTVTFEDGSTVLGSSSLADVYGQNEATWTTSTLALGSHAITAIYSGDSNYQSNSASLTQNVNQVSTTEQLTSSSNPSTPSQSVTFTAIVTGAGGASGGGTPTGTVTFKDGQTELGSSSLAVVNGQDEATWTVSSLSLGSHEITATYSGDNTFLGSTATLQQNVNQLNSSVALTSSANPSLLNQSVTFTANVSSGASGGGTPTGTVEFLDGQTELGSSPLAVFNGQDEATWTTSALALGSHQIVAQYSGDNTFQASSATLTQTVTAGPTITVTNPGDQTNWQDDAVALQLNATDSDGDPLTYSATGLPSGLSINAATGLISGVLAAPAGANSPYSVTVSASDGTNTASRSFTWTVARVQIDPLADQSNLIGDSVSVGVNAFDQSGQALSYSASGLPPGVSINSTTGLLSGTIASNASITTPYNVTVTVTDGTDLASTSFAWTIGNFTLDNPGDQTNAEGDAVALQPTVESNGTPNLTYSATGLPAGLAINPNTGLIAGTISNLDSNSSPYSVTVSATDGTSTSSQTFNWTVTHVLLTAPTDPINAPGDVVSLQVQASDPDGDTLTYTATSLPSGLGINSSTGLISGTISSTAGSDTAYSVTVTASDGTHSTSSTFNWTVSNQTVTVTNPGTQNSAEGANISLPINATNPTGNPLSYTATGLPAGLQIDYASGIISGTIDGAAAETNGGVYMVTVLADDGQGNNGSTSFTWNITHTNQTPTLDNPGDQSDRAGDVVSLPLYGYDGDGDNVTYAAAGLPAGLSVDPSTGIISGTLPVSAASATPYSMTVSASDGSLTANQSFNWTVTASQVVLTSPGDQTNTEGDNVSLQLVATDSGNLPLSYQVSGLPAGLSVSNSGLISGTIAAGAAANGPNSVIVTATDTAGNSDGKEFVWNVNPVNLTPVVSNPGPQINAQSDVLSLQIQATDPAGNGLTYSAGGLPPGLTIDPSSGLISGVLSSNSASGSPYSVTVTAADGSNSGSTTFTWSVTNQSVTVTDPGTQNSTAGAAVSLQISASDSAQLPLTYAAVGLPPGASIDPSTGLISGTLTSTDGGAYQVTVMASDSAGNSGSASFVWNVTYLNQAPTLVNPGDQLNNAGDSVSLPLSAYDVDGDSLTYSAVGLPSGLGIDAATGLISGVLSASSSGSPYTVTVTASDGTLSASQTFRWFVVSGSVVLSNPGDQTNNEGDNVSLPLAASDSEQLSLNYTAAGLPPGLSIDGSTGLISGTVASGASANGPYVVTVQATDSAGNSAAQQFTWNVNAQVHAPTLTNPGPQSSAGGDNVSLQVQATDTDVDTLEYAASGLPLGLSIDPDSGLISGTIQYSAAQMAGGHYNVTLMVRDGNGSLASQSFSWTVRQASQELWLDEPANQDNQTGSIVSLTLVGGSSVGKPLAYSASGLPAGLTVNPTTGLISGTITAPAGEYAVKAAVTEGDEEDDESFTWQVYAEDKKDEKPISLQVNSVGEPIKGAQGAVAWGITWQLKGGEPKGGYVIQHVKITSSVNYGANKGVMHPALQDMETLDYWEAWPMQPGATESSTVNLPAGVRADFRPYFTRANNMKLDDLKATDFYFVRPIRAAGCQGTMSFEGTAYYFDGMTEEQIKDLGFHVGSRTEGKVSPAVNLLYLPNAEGVQDKILEHTHTSSVKHNMTVKWDDVKKTIDAVTEPSVGKR